MENTNPLVAHIAQADFERARRKAFFNDLGAIVQRKSNELASFEEIERAIPIKGRYYRGLQQVPISAILGSVDRYRDFDREFLPTQSHTRPRWESVDIASLTDVSLPPIQLYKVGDVYFVKDGNHRVSVAKEKGASYIDAEVIECSTTVPFHSIPDQQKLLKLGEYARFLEQTRLDKLRKDVCIEFSTLGRYDTLIEHISAHRWYMGIEKNRPVEWEEAVLDWYDNIYMPVVRAITESNVLEDFPGHTPADLYLWIMDHRWYFKQETGQEMGPQTAVLHYDSQHGSWSRKVVRFLRRMRMTATRPLVITAQRIARAMEAGMPDGDTPAGGYEGPEPQTDAQAGSGAGTPQRE